MHHSPAAGAHLAFWTSTTARDKKGCKNRQTRRAAREQQTRQMCTWRDSLASNANVIECKWWGFAAETQTPGKAGWDGARRCAHLPRPLLHESTCSPSYLLPFSLLTAAAIFPCCLVSSHIRSKKMVSSSEWKCTGWAGAALCGVCVCARTAIRLTGYLISNL